MSSGVTSLRVYLGGLTDEGVHSVAEAIADLLAARGFNAEDTVQAVIVCESGTPDVQAFADGAESFIAHTRDCAFLLIPGANLEEESDDPA